MSTFRRGLTAFVFVAQAYGGAAWAQSNTGSLQAAQGATVDQFARDRGVSVRERPRPDYEALGLPLGALTAYPRIQIEGEYNDNIFAVENGADSDQILRIRPELQVSSGWSRHALQAYARAVIRRYKDFETENTEDWTVGANGRIDVSRATNASMGADFSQASEPRSSTNAPTSSVEPIQYDNATAFVAAAHASGRLKLSGRGEYRKLDYQDGRSFINTVVDQDFRDRSISLVAGRADVAVSPATALFVQVSANSKDYEAISTPTAAARDSSGYEVLTGANFELGAVMRGEVAAGYISQQFDDTIYPDIDGFGARVSIEWFPTQLTTITGTASRTIEDSGVIGIGGYLSTSVGVRVDHELTRNVILGGQLTYVQDDYSGVDRNDDRLGVGVDATYLVNRRFGVNLAANHLEQSSHGALGGANFDINRLSVSLVTQF